MNSTRAFGTLTELHKDEMYRFARQSQIAAEAFLPPTDSLRVLCTAWQVVRSAPASGPYRSIGTKCQIIASVAKHVFEFGPLELASVGSPSEQMKAAERLVIHALNLVLEQHTRASLTLSEAANELGVSVRYLSRTVHATSGDKFATHLSGIRMLAAAFLLTSTASDVRTIAGLSGYHHTGELDRDFRKWLGLTPRLFRQLLVSHSAAFTYGLAQEDVGFESRRPGASGLRSS